MTDKPMTATEILRRRAEEAPKVNASFDKVMQPLRNQIGAWAMAWMAQRDEAAAWRRIARERANFPERFKKAGLCYQVMDLYERRVISQPLAKWMLSRIYHRMPLNEKTGRFAMHAYRKKEQPVAHEARIIAALWFALESA